MNLINTSLSYSKNIKPGESANVFEITFDVMFLLMSARILQIPSKDIVLVMMTLNLEEDTNWGSEEQFSVSKNFLFLSLKCTPYIPVPNCKRGAELQRWVGETCLTP